ncbi:MAG: hypothetical protein HC934_01130 [Acaryochloridaceae cyanobacterium SU_2_1]|nr:hypothetical protein [Acaryochloridaceae cyanobacterium SU_2_1]
MIIILVSAAGLGLWSLQLMRKARQSEEASLIFAGALVALSAMGLVAVYLLMDGCMGYFTGSQPLLSLLPVY